MDSSPEPGTSSFFCQYEEVLFGVDVKPPISYKKNQGTMCDDESK